MKSLAQMPALPMMIAAMLFIGAAHAQEPGEAWTLSQGGKLYDNHWLVTGKPAPVKRNPDYPADVKALPADTWRCVSCHGWDYSGKDGHLGKSRKPPIFASLRQAAGKKFADLKTAMLAPGHRAYVAALDEGSIDALARFVSAGQFNAGKLMPGGRSVGDAVAGREIFEGACISCHQADGKAFIEGEAGDQPALGWVAKNRPAQALHKIINGVPGADMLSLRFLPEQSRADLLAYLQTLDDSVD
ncbi:MAG: c-type cytochrome [Rhizobiales bacterium]|nr:c-type cytochrome [Hyphomicrobiales bacterium]